MQPSFRWYGPDDPVPLSHIRQIPGVRHIVGALYDVPAGDVWPRTALERLHAAIEAEDLQWTVAESIPVSESIKLGRPDRDRHIEAFCQSLENVAAIGVEVVCYNFMPVVDWTRTALDAPLPDGSTTLGYEDEQAQQLETAVDLTNLPGWDVRFDRDELHALVNAYRSLSSEHLWENLAYFLDRVVPVAERAGVKLAIHPDDPPWPVFGIPRIITSGNALHRVTQLVDRRTNGVTLCTGSLGVDPAQDLPALIRRLADRIHFVHARNVSLTGNKQFHETAHPNGDIDLPAVLRALKETGFDGPLRPDHGRMIWGEKGQPGYGLYDRALGATYLQGIWSAL